MIEGIIPEEIAAEPDAIRATVREAREQARAAAAALRSAGTRRLYVIGNGTSYHSALAIAFAHRRLARGNDLILLPMTAGEFRTYLPALAEGDALLAISASGEFRDVVAVVDELRGRLPIAAVVNVPDSTLARTAGHVVLSAGGPSAVPVMTKTFAATLSAGLLVAGELLGGHRADVMARDLQAAADAAAIAIGLAMAVVADLAQRHAATEHLHVIGGGGGYPAALEAALKLTEMARVHAEGSEVWEAESGVATLLGPQTTVIALAPPGPGQPAVRALARNSAAWGARLIEVAPERTVDGAELLAIPATASEDLAALTSVPPVALFADALARARGLDPDHPEWTARYRAQGLTHVVGSETTA